MLLRATEESSGRRALDLLDGASQADKNPCSMTNDLDGMAVFVAVADAKGFRAAGERLGVSASAVSQTLRRREERLGVALIQRTTRSVRLTEAGERLYAAARPALDELRKAAAALGEMSNTPRGTLRLHVSNAAESFLDASLLAEFLDRLTTTRLRVAPARQCQREARAWAIVGDEWSRGGMRLRSPCRWVHTTARNCPFALRHRPPTLSFLLPVGSEAMKRVLVVDDSATMRRMVIAALSPLGDLAFEQAVSGLEAIERVTLSPVDLVLLDLNMPDMHGLEVLRFIRGQAALRALPVVILTTRSDDDSRSAALRDGATLYLTKPFVPAAIASELRPLLQ